MSASATPELKSTPLTAAHRALGARMAPFAGYDMPIQYADGVLKEHLWTRSSAGLFDVSHMGPALVVLDNPTGDAEADHAAVCALVEPLICADLIGLKPGAQRYSLLLNADGQWNRDAALLPAQINTIRHCWSCHRACQTCSCVAGCAVD